MKKKAKRYNPLDLDTDGPFGEAPFPCCNCKHSVELPFSGMMCSNPAISQPDHVNGGVIEKSAYLQRSKKGICKEVGEFFEERRYRFFKGF